MEKYLVKKSLSATIFVLFAIMMEVIMFISIGMGVMPVYWLIDVSGYILFAVIVFLLPLKVQNVMLAITLIAHAVLCLVNICLFASAGRIFDWPMIFLMGEAAEAMGMAIFPVLEIVLISSIVLSYLLMIIFLFVCKGSYYKKFIKKASNLIFVGLMVCLVLIQAVMPSRILKNYEEETYFTSDSFEYVTLESAYNSLNKFGLVGFYASKLVRYVIPSITPKSLHGVTDYEFDYYTSSLSNVLKDDNVIFILAESFDEYGVSSELTPVLYSLKNGVNLSEIGISKFYNVSYDSSGQRILSRKDYTKISEEEYVKNGVNIFDGLMFDECGLELESYKSSESTNVSEQRVLTGNFLTYDYSLPAMLSGAGYNTRYVHGNYGKFYHRHSYIPYKVGFDSAFFYDEMEDNIENTGTLNCWLRDSDIVNYYSCHEDEFDFTPDEKFLTFFLTITTHGGYPDSKILEPYYPLLEAIANSETDSSLMSLYNSLSDTELKSAVKNYFASAMDTEIMVALLIDELFTEGKLDDTLLVFAPDHNAYANNILSFKEKYYNECLGKLWAGDASATNGISFFYSTQINKSTVEDYDKLRVVSHVTCAFDLVPTILTLVGVDYMQEHYMGYAVINKSIKTNEHIYNKVVGSNTNSSFIGEGFVTMDGVVIESLLDLPDYVTNNATNWVNEYKKKALYNEYILSKSKKDLL